MESSELEVLVGRTEKVATKKGEVTVRELVIEDVVGLTDALVLLYKNVDLTKVKESSSFDSLLSVIGKKNILEALKAVLTAVTDSPTGFFDRFTIVDTLKITLAFLRVNDWEELKTLFFELRRLVPQKANPPT